MSAGERHKSGFSGNTVRLQKYLSEAGVSSRRGAEEIIREGRVRVNGKPVTELGARVDPARDAVTLDGKRIRPKPYKYVILHKPPGVVSTREDPRGRPKVVDLVPDLGVRLYPVGRLDFDASGVMLLTNDGDVAAVMTHPSYHTPRTYLVKVKGRPGEKDLERLRTGVKLDDGKKTLPARVEPVKVRRGQRTPASNTWLKFTIKEGRHRQLKRMCRAVRHPALKIERVRMGPIKLGDLPVGGWRYASREEIRALRQLAMKVEKKRNKP